MKTRPFEKLSERDKLFILLNCISLAIREDVDMQIKWRTDCIGVALQYSGKYLKLKRNDFDLIRNLTIDEIIKKTVAMKPSQTKSV